MEICHHLPSHLGVSALLYLSAVHRAVPPRVLTSREIESREHVVGGAGVGGLFRLLKWLWAGLWPFLCLPEGWLVDEYLLVLLRASDLKSLSHRYNGDGGGL